MRSIHMEIVMILLLAAVLRAGAQQPALADVLSGKATPITVKVKEMGDGWMQVTVRGDEGESILTTLMLVSRLGDIGGAIQELFQPTTYYTRGQTVTCGDQVFLVAYAFPGKPFASRMMEMMLHAGEPASTTLPITAETTLSLSLLNVNSINALTDIQPVDVKKILAGAGQLMQAMTRAELHAKEATLKANLQQLRNAVERFQADCGVYPATLADLVAVKPPVRGAGGVEIPKDTYLGPYLMREGGVAEAPGVPVNPFVDMSGKEPASTKLATHWKYIPDQGLIRIPDALADRVTLDGIRYGNL